MDIKALLGDSYKDGMSVEEINAALADKTFVDPTTLPKSVDKDMFDKKVSELAKVNKELNELKNSSMTSEEKIQEALKEAETSRIEFAKKSTRLDVEKVFIDGGLKESEYKDIIDGIVTENSETSVNLAKQMMEVIKNQTTAAEKALKAKMLEDSPKPPAGDPPTDKKPNFGKMSLAEIDQYYKDHPDEIPKN